MSTIVLVTDDTLFNGHVEDEIIARLGNGPMRIHVMMPVATIRSAWTISEGAEHVIAQARLGDDLRRLQQLGADASGEVVADHMVDAVQRAVAALHADEVIVSSVDHPVARMLHRDLPHRIERAVTVPVRTVVAADRAHA